MSEDSKIREVPFAEHARTRREVQAEIAAVNWLLQHYAADLPPASPTALAIGRGASWQEIGALARWEGVEEVVALLEEAGRTLGEEVPPEAARVLDSSAEASRLKTNPIPLPGADKPQPVARDENGHPPGD